MVSVSCDMDFFNCRYRYKDDEPGCRYECQSDKCVYGLIHSRFKKREINLANKDAHEQGYRHGSPAVEEHLLSFNKKDYFVQMNDKSSKFWIKYLKANRFKVVPFNPKKVDAETQILPIDAKRFFYQQRIKPAHAEQLHGYALSLRQQYGIEDVPYFIEVLNRPNRRVKGAFDKFKQHLLGFYPGNELEELLISKVKKSYEHQKSLLESSLIFQKTKEEMACNGYCNGCFSSELCNKIGQMIDGHTLKELLTDELKVIPEDYKPRWSCVGEKCDIRKVLSVIDKEKLPEELKVKTIDTAVIGYILHAAFNQQHRIDFVHNQILEDIGIKPVSRTSYCELPLQLKIDDFVITGHTDAVFMLQKN